MARNNYDNYYQFQQKGVRSFLGPWAKAPRLGTLTDRTLPGGPAETGEGRFRRASGEGLL